MSMYAIFFLGIVIGAAVGVLTLSIFIGSK